MCGRMYVNVHSNCRVVDASSVLRDHLVAVVFTVAIGIFLFIAVQIYTIPDRL
jgi:hypothetical protein